MKNNRYSNDDNNEISPYLLQCGRNPVQQRLWKEAFEHESTATLQNVHGAPANLNCIERPVFDETHNHSVCLPTRSDERLLSAFSAPDPSPFCGKTCFPLSDACARTVFETLLRKIARVMGSMRPRFTAHAEKLIVSIARYAALCAREKKNLRRQGWTQLTTLSGNRSMHTLADSIPLLLLIKKN